MQEIKNKIRTIPHWPKQGVMFRDITTVLKDPYCFSKIIDSFYERYKDLDIDLIVGIEIRGFILASALALKMSKGFVPIRKTGKLPAATTRIEYELEYGKDSLEIHNDAIIPGQNVLLIDDLIATSGTSLAAARLIKQLGGKIIEIAFLIELIDLKGKDKLMNKGYKTFSLLQFEGK